VVWAAFFFAAIIFGTACLDHGLRHDRPQGRDERRCAQQAPTPSCGPHHWYWLPTSSSHALIGGYAGAAVAKAGPAAILVSGWTKTLLFIVLSPLIGLGLGFGFMVIIFWLCRRTAPSRVDSLFRRLQLISAALFSLGHGANDAQKTMGIIASALFAGGYIATFEIPLWVELAAYTARHALRRLAHHHDGLESRGCSRWAASPPKPPAPCFVASSMGVPVTPPTPSQRHRRRGLGAAHVGRALGHRRAIVWAWVLTVGLGDHLRRHLLPARGRRLQVSAGRGAAGSHRGTAPPRARFSTVTAPPCRSRISRWRAGRAAGRPRGCHAASVRTPAHVFRAGCGPLSDTVMTSIAPSAAA
jgi:PiT family inorganic phosphate transporter